MGKSQRIKGHTFERKIAQEMRSIGYSEAKRNLEYQQGQGIDIVGVDPFFIQCKKQKKVNIKEAYREAEKGTPDSNIPLAITQDDREGILVTMSFQDFKFLAEVLRKEDIL